MDITIEDAKRLIEWADHAAHERGMSDADITLVHRLKAEFPAVLDDDRLYGLENRCLPILLRRLTEG